MAKNFSSFSKALLKAKTEEEVKHAYAAHFNLDYDTEFRHDLYSPEIFFEFKFSRSLQKRNSQKQLWSTLTLTYHSGMRKDHSVNLMLLTKITRHP